MSEKRDSRSDTDAVKIKTYEENSKDAEGTQAPVEDAPEEPAKESRKAEDRKEGDDLAVQLEAAEKKAGENYDRFLRISAEFENYKKRKDRETTDFRKYANESLVKELLPVVDNLERAIETSADHDDAVSCILEGVDMTLKEVLKVLEKFAVKAVEAVGNPFDPTYHQAVMQEASAEHPENTVIKELQKGYTIHDRLLRPSMVVVTKAASE